MTQGDCQVVLWDESGVGGGRQGCGRAGEGIGAPASKRQALAPVVSSVSLRKSNWHGLDSLHSHLGWVEGR